MAMDGKQEESKRMNSSTSVPVRTPSSRTTEIKIEKGCAVGNQGPEKIPANQHLPSGRRPPKLPHNKSRFHPSLCIRYFSRPLVRLSTRFDRFSESSLAAQIGF